MMATFSTIDALRTLTTSVPDWNKRLDDLNGQIAARQIELAQLQEHERPPTRSLKNKGSTESLRPKDAANESPFFTNDTDESNPIEASEAPKENVRPNSPAAARIAASSSSPLPLPAGLQRNSSQPIPPHNQPRLPDFTKLRKRKTESLASGESQTPKYRTRSMIIVYYDSAVQTAFEDLVKFVSGSRNSMRKGKMAAKMAEMRRAAELEVDDEEDEDEDEEEESSPGKPLTPFKSSALLAAAKKDVAKGATEADDDDDDDEEYTMPKLQFVSTRQMGPSRDHKSNNMPSIGMLRGYRRSGNQGGAPDIFDELDKGLEWCQAQCERAAHQFLRDGDCSEEIENIKRRLAEVKEKAEKEVERLEKEECPARISARRPEAKPRGLSSIKVRKEQLSSNMKELEVDDGEMEVDEGIENDDGPPTLVYKKARDYAR